MPKRLNLAPEERVIYFKVQNKLKQRKWRKANPDKWAKIVERRKAKIKAEKVIHS